MSDNTYNGWSNYETWCVKLWIDNEQGSQEYAQELAQSAVSDANWTADEVKRDEKYPLDAVDLLMSSLEEWVTDPDAGYMPELQASMASDLLTHAFGMVEWYETATAYVEELTA